MGKLLNTSAAAALALVAFVAGLQLGQANDTWQLVLEQHGDAYVMDYGLSQSDCFEALQMHPSAGWSCEREG